MVALILAGCATGPIGKTYPTDKLGRLSNTSNTVTWTDGDYVIYHVEDQKLVGKLVFAAKPGVSGNEWIQLTLTAYFADGNGLICNMSSCSWSWSDNVTMAEELKFSIDMPQDYKNLEYVTFSYRGTYGN